MLQCAESTYLDHGRLPFPLFVCPRFFDCTSPEAVVVIVSIVAEVSGDVTPVFVKDEEGEGEAGYKNGTVNKDGDRSSNK